MWTERHLVLQVMPASTQADEIAGHPLPSPDDAEEPMRTNLTPLSPAEQDAEEAAGKHCSAASLELVHFPAHQVQVTHAKSTVSMQRCWQACGQAMILPVGLSIVVR